MKTAITPVEKILILIYRQKKKKIFLITILTKKSFELVKCDANWVVHRNYYLQQKNLLSPVVFFLAHPVHLRNLKKAFISIFY